MSERSLPTWTNEQLLIRLEIWTIHTCPSGLTLSAIPDLDDSFEEAVNEGKYTLQYKMSSHSLAVVGLDMRQARIVDTWMKAMQLGPYVLPDHTPSNWQEQPMAMYPLMETINE